MSELAAVQEPNVVPERNTPELQRPEPTDVSAARKVEQRYVDAINVLMKDALDHGNLHILTDVLTWALGRVIVGCGTVAVAGDVMRRLGGHVCNSVERQRAAEEATQARKAGLRPH